MANLDINGIITRLCVKLQEKFAPIDVVPEVTSADNGKVLMVVDGAWVAGSIPSAAGVSF